MLLYFDRRVAVKDRIGPRPSSLAKSSTVWSLLMKYLVRLREALTPARLLTWLLGRLAACQGGWFTRVWIRLFCKAYGVKLDEAVAPKPDDYPTFNAFFMRALRPGARPLSASLGVMPADGKLVQFGKIQRQALIQAKGIEFSVAALLTDSEMAKLFEEGWFCTIYLAPGDYHRVHMPHAGRLLETIMVPGALFSVNQRSVDAIPGLFAKNERLVTLFETKQGHIAQVLVGATIVGSMVTPWAGKLLSRAYQRTRFTASSNQAIHLGKGEEMGAFAMGSTVITLFERGFGVPEASLAPQQRVQMGQTLLHQRDVMT